MTRYMKVESVQNIFQRTTLTTEEHNDILSTLTFSDNCPVHGVHLRERFQHLPTFVLWGYGKKRIIAFGFSATVKFSVYRLPNQALKLTKWAWCKIHGG